MESLGETKHAPFGEGGDAGFRRSCMLELPLGDSVTTFDLEKAVCSHGLFMMSPNRWNHVSKTLTRPLRVDSDDDASNSSLLVQISHPSDTPASLVVRVFGADYLSPRHQQSLLYQVKRMLRLSDTEERKLRDFQQLYGEAKEKGCGRMFRSPTLFEDMVKWSRSLSMARSLCELQLELQCPSYNKSIVETEHFAPTTPQKELKMNKANDVSQTDHIIPKTPAVKETKRKAKVSKSSTISLSLHKKEDYCKHCDVNSSERIGNFPSPEEVANLDEEFLAKRCNLGYRGSRILSLAKCVVEGDIDMDQLEEASRIPSLLNYEKLSDQLKAIKGFGPFTCANVLMCMGFYHVIPADSETIRHLKQVHAVKSSVKTVKEEAEKMYEKYAPFQFLVYWSEVWSFYEQRFGKMSEMSHSNYKLVTAANMKSKERCNKKKSKVT